MVELRIVLDDHGRIAVTGPIENQLLCYGLLEMARDAIATNAQQQQRLVQPATALPSTLKGES